MSSRAPGFTLIELMVTVAVVAILAAVAVPSYGAYLQRSRVPPALDALSAMYTRMEQRFQDTGSYAGAGGGCAASLPTATNFTIACRLAAGGGGYLATATGSGAMDGYAYTIDQQGTRATTAHPKGVPPTACWTLRGVSCDT